MSTRFFTLCQYLNLLQPASNSPSKKVNQIPFLYNQEMKPRISKQVVGHDRRIYTTIHHNRLRNNLYFKFQFLKYPSTAIFFCHRIETRGIKRPSMEAPGRDKYVGLHRRKKLLGVKNFHGAQKLRPLYDCTSSEGHQLELDKTLKTKHSYWSNAKSRAIRITIRPVLLG